MCVKLIALDLDGTVMDSKNNISEKTSKTLTKAVKQGIHVVLCTGRTLRAIDPRILSIKGVRYVIYSNGAAIYDLKKDERIYSDTISFEKALRVLKVAYEFEVCPAVFFNYEAFVPESCFDRPERFGLNPDMLNYFKSTRKPVKSIETLLEEKQSAVDKIFLMIKPGEQYQALLSILLKIDDISITSSAANNIEVLNHSANKGDALAYLCNELSVPQDNVMAIGDSPNDEDMLRFAEHSVAMGNSYPHVKEMCKYVTGTNDEDGVAMAIIKYALR